MVCRLELQIGQLTVWYTKQDLERGRSFPSSYIAFFLFRNTYQIRKDFDHGGSGNQRGRDTDRFAGVCLVSLSAAGD